MLHCNNNHIEIEFKEREIETFEPHLEHRARTHKRLQLNELSTSQMFNLQTRRKGEKSTKSRL